MNYEVLKGFEIKDNKFTPDGFINLNPEGRITELLLQKGKIKPIKPIPPVMIYSEILQDYLWMVETERDKGDLIKEGIQNAIYTANEIKEMRSKELPKEALKDIHEVKKVFDKGKIESVKNNGKA